MSNAEEARTDLRHHDLATQLDPAARQLPGLQRSVAALDSWQHWANGDTVDVDELRDAVQVLTTDDGGADRAGRCRVLGEAIQGWASAAGVDLPIADRRPPAPEHAGPELGL